MLRCPRRWGPGSFAANDLSSVREQFVVNFWRGNEIYMGRAGLTFKLRFSRGLVQYVAVALPLLFLFGSLFMCLYRNSTTRGELTKREAYDTTYTVCSCALCPSKPQGFLALIFLLHNKQLI